MEKLLGGVIRRRFKLSIALPSIRKPKWTRLKRRYSTYYPATTTNKYYDPLHAAPESVLIHAAIASMESGSVEVPFIIEGAATLQST